MANGRMVGKVEDRGAPLDDLVALLNRYQQRATYGAIAGVLGRTPRGLMKDRPITFENSWVVAKSTKRQSGSRRGWPTGYRVDQIHEECLRQINEEPGNFIDDQDALRSWLGELNSGNPATGTIQPAWEQILARTADIPDEEWDRLPVDLAEQHDHYLYGTPKRTTS